MNLVQLAKEVGRIAKEAGAVILDIYDTADFGVEQKADDSPLTIADREANKVICDGLEALEVRYPIISEENKAIPYEERKDFEYAWLVDPLDGTKEFIKRNGEFTVNIALICKNQIVLGVVYTPVSDDLYWAVKGEGAYLVKDDGTTKLSANSFAMTDEGLGVVCSRSHLNEATQAFVDGLTNPARVPKGSSLKFLILAQGGAHLYPRLAPTMEWDTGAAQIVLEEAGGKVIAQDTNAPLQYNKENLLNPHFIAYGAVSE
ncbi:MAG: 3'(2'),5'-bisphosphate nucleotidase CysQ [Bacteroidota bacterium]